MKLIRNCIRTLFAAFVVALVLGCSSSRTVPSASSGSAFQKWKTVDADRLAEIVVALSDDGGYSYREFLRIKDRELITRLFLQLSSRECENVKTYFMIAPKLLIFLDERGDFECAFLYWPAGKPEHIFMPCTLQTNNPPYRVVSYSKGAAVTLMNFDKMMRPYFDVWKH